MRALCQDSAVSRRVFGKRNFRSRSPGARFQNRMLSFFKRHYKKTGIFLIWHEITAVGCLVLVYPFTSFVKKDSIDNVYLERATRTLEKYLPVYSQEVLVRTAATFFVVKLLYPVRIGLSLLLTRMMKKYH